MILASLTNLESAATVGNEPRWLKELSLDIVEGQLDYLDVGQVGRSGLRGWLKLLVGRGSCVVQVSVWRLSHLGCNKRLF